MNAALLVAGRDLRAMARSWLAWSLLAGGLLVEGLLFYVMGLGAEGPRLSGDVLLRFLDGAGAIAIGVAVILGVRSFAAERDRGTLVLLATAPVSAGSLVVGKLLAGLAILTALQVASLHMPALVLVHGRIAAAHVAVGLLGVLLLGASALAIAILASILARTQAAATVIAAVILGALLLASMLARTTDPPWSEVLDALALHQRHQRPFMRGVLRVEHVVFHLALTSTALLAAARALRARRWS